MSGGLHAHEIHVVHGRLSASMADDDGRGIAIDLSPDDHPALHEAWVRFNEALVAACETVMLDLIASAGRGIAPEDASEVCSVLCTDVPCRVCGALVTVEPYDPKDRGHVLRTTYCHEHAPADHG